MIDELKTKDSIHQSPHNVYVIPVVAFSSHSTSSI
jgi:hypothetical protein